ncbi:hypothetical protein [Oleidesulfovibrio sp.]|uniref:hypothetical protein n=1 Tax=Oleidesulfovibrio sp. TaxID=2909707 RepID=UPI003A83B8DA
METAFGEGLDWQERPERISSKVSIELKLEADGFVSDSWAEMTEWFTVTLPRFAQALEKPLSQIKASQASVQKGVE